MLREARMHNSVPASLTVDLKPYGSLVDFENFTGIVFEKDKAKLLLKWFAPSKPPAYVMLRNDESVQFCTGDGRTPCGAHGTWSYFKEPNGSEFLMTWFHWSGKRNSDRLPQAEATVLQKETEESSMFQDVPVWRAVTTLTHVVETFILRKFVGVGAKIIRFWHGFVQVVSRSQV